MRTPENFFPARQNRVGKPEITTGEENMIALAAKPLVERKNREIRDRVSAFSDRYGRRPKLSVVLVGKDPASIIYTKKKGEAAGALGMEHETITLTGTASILEVKSVVDRLNSDPQVDGILIQRPLPKTFREEEVVLWIRPEKDVDAFHPLNAGKLHLGLPCLQPCTPTGIMCLLKHYNINVTGILACIIGRSSIVGKPMAALLIQSNATLIHCHSKTRNLVNLTRQADLLIVAAGKPGLVGKSHIRPGAVVIDVGIHRTVEGRIVGDVIYEDALPLAAAMTPVPGGVGPMTISMLMENTITAAELRSSGQSP